MRFLEMCKGNRAAARLLVIALLVLACGAPALAQSISSATAVHASDPAANEQTAAHATAALIADTSAIEAGKPFRLGVDLRMQPGWHTYYKVSGDAGMPTKIDWHLPDGYKIGPLQWEKPERFDEAGIITYGYQNHTLIAAEVTPPAKLPPNGNVDFSARVKWLTCKDLCVPGQAQVALSLPVAGAGVAAGPGDAARFALVGYSGGLPQQNILDTTLHVEGASQKPTSYLTYLALAFVGGFILNFMPCVLPVISIKVLSFVQQAGEDPRKIFRLGLIFSAGIVLSFLALAGVVVGVQQAGQSVGWGFQFQYPGFVIAMAVIVLALAMSLFGFFYVPAPAGSQIDKLASKEGYSGTFFKGVLATVLATPCTAPFLGTALGFAFAQPWWTVMAVFLSIGLGMACPYLLLTAQPAWMKYIPKPGVWMEHFKEAMGFLLLGTVVWLLYVLGQQVGAEGVIWTCAFLLAVAFAAWLISRFTNLSSTTQRKYVVWSLAIATVIGAYFSCLTNVFQIQSAGSKMPAAEASTHTGVSGGASPIAWQDFSIDKLDDSLQQHKTVLLDFTAAWCLTCKVNEQTVLSSAPVMQKMKALNVVALRADWTRQDPTISKLLAKFGRSGVPLYVLFPAQRPTEPIVLPEVITQDIMLQKLAEAGPSS